MNVEFIPGIASVSGTLYKGKNGLRELKRQDLFAQRQSYVKQLMAADPGLSKKEAWSIAKRDIN